MQTYQNWQSNSQVATVMFNNELYNDAIEFASKIIKFEKANVNPIDVVHDLLIDGNISYSDYMNKIKSKVRNEKTSLKTINIDTIYWKRPLPFKTNIDFTCTICKDIFPECEQTQHYSSKGFYVIKNTCKECRKKQANTWSRNAYANKNAQIIEVANNGI